MSEFMDHSGIEITVLRELGDVYFRQDKDEDAINCYQDALYLAEEQQNTQECLTLIANLARIQLQQGNYQTAFTIITDARQKYQSGSLSSIWPVITVLLDTLINMNAINETRQLQDELRADLTATSRNNLSLWSYFIWKSAEIDWMERRLNDAKKGLIEALELHMNSSQNTMIPMITLDLIDVLISSGDYNSAQIHLHHLENSLKNLETLSYQVQALYFKGLILRGLKQIDGSETRAILKEALRKIRYIKRPELTWRLHFQTACELENDDELESALGHFEKAAALIRDLFNRVPPEYRSGYLSHPILRKNIDKMEAHRLKVFGRNKTGWTPQSDMLDIPSSRLSGIITGDPEWDQRNIEIVLQMLELIGKTGLNLNELLRGFLLKVLEASGAERGIILFTAENDLLEVHMALDRDGNPIDGIDRFSQSVPQDTVKSRKPICIRKAFDDAEDLDPRHSMIAFRLRSVMCVPLATEQNILGVLYIDSQATIKEFQNRDLELLTSLCRHLALHIENARFWADQRSLEDARRQRLEEEIDRLQKNLSAQNILVGESPVMQFLFSNIYQVAKTDVTALLLGETGTGKESIARLIHDSSSRCHKPFVIIDAGTIPESLLESELFGHEKGSFTGAISRKIGKFELANGGTVFLDEIGDLPLNLQGKLLRVLEQREIERVGGSQIIKVDIRIVAATNRDLREMVDQGKFRGDLYFRLNVVRVRIPPLRERGQDKMVLAAFFLKQFGRDYKKDILGFTRGTEKLIESYEWPGNVREMKHRIQRGVVLASGSYLTETDLDFEIPANETHLISQQIPSVILHDIQDEDELIVKIIQDIMSRSLGGSIRMRIMEPLEQLLVDEALAMTGGNRTRAAWLLGLERRKIVRLMDKLSNMETPDWQYEPLQKLKNRFMTILLERDKYAMDRLDHPNIFDELTQKFIMKTWELTKHDVGLAAKITGISESTYRKRVAKPPAKEQENQ